MRNTSYALGTAMCAIAATSFLWDIFCVIKGSPTVTEMVRSQFVLKWVAGVSTGLLVALHFVHGAK